MSTDLARQVIAAYAEIDLSRRLQELGVANAKRKALQREHAEVEQRVPFLDRVIFFSDTEDEKRVKELAATIQKENRALALQRKAIDADLDVLSARFAPVELWRRIDHCLKLAQTDLQISGVFKKAKKPKALLAALRDLAARVLKLYVPDFDAQTLVETLRDEETCRRLSRPASEITKPHPELGFEPISLDDLMALTAGRMLEAAFFRAEAQLNRIKDKEARYKEKWAEAAQAVKLIDDLNVFSDSPEERHRNEMAKEARAARDQWIATDEANRLEMSSFLEAYPPLFLHLKVGAVLGAISAIGPTKEPQINEKTGVVDLVTVVEPRALVQASLLGLRKAFLKVFPGIPMPSTVEHDAEMSARAHATVGNTPSNQILRDFTRSMDRREGEQQLDQCLVHASMQHAWHQTRLKVGDRVSWADKLALWSKNADESLIDHAKAREKWHKSALKDRWAEMLAMATEAAHEQPPLLIRDLTISANQHLHAIGTTSPCQVNSNQNKTRRILSDLRDYIGRCYGLQGTREQFMADVANHIGTHAPTNAPPVEAFRHRSYEEVVEIVARYLFNTSFRDEFIVLSKDSRKWHEAQARQSEVKSKISFWDMVNVFSDTEEEKERNVLKQQMGQINAQIQMRSSRVNAWLDGALAHYPPGRLYYMLGGVDAAVAAIYARLVTRTYRDSEGRTRRTTSCELYGKSRAVSAMTNWNFALVQAYGPLPGVHECLERWVAF